MGDDSRELTDKEKAILQLLTCPKCHGPRIPVSHGVACENWNCGGVTPTSKKELSAVRRYLNERNKNG